MRIPGVACVVLSSVLVAGCSSDPVSGGASSSGGATAAASPAARDLGPDRSPEEYRALDLCAMVDFPAVLAAAGADAPDLVEQPSVPGQCIAEAPNGYVRWAVGAPREQLPTAVTAPNEVTEDVDVTVDGEVITDKACSTAHVVVKGYVLSVSGPAPAQAGYCAVVRGVADAVRGAVAGEPALLPESAPVTATSDLCEALTEVGVADLYSAAITPATADHRACAISRGGAAVLNFVRTSNPPYGFAPGGEGQSHGAAFRNDDGCITSVFADDGMVKGGHWWVFQDLGPREACEATVDARAVLLVTLLGPR